MTKYQVLQLIKFEDLFTGENNADPKDWLDREDVLDFISDLDDGDSHLLELMLKNVDEVWEAYKDAVNLAEILYKKAPHIADAIKKELFKTSTKNQEILYMMIEDFLEEFVDVEGMKDMRDHEEEQDTDWYYEEMKLKEREDNE